MMGEGQICASPGIYTWLELQAKIGCDQVFDFKCSSHEKGRLKTHPPCPWQQWQGAVTQLPELNLNLKTDTVAFLTVCNAQF